MTPTRRPGRRRVLAALALTLAIPAAGAQPPRGAATMTCSRYESRLVSGGTAVPRALERAGQDAEHAGDARGALYCRALAALARSYAGEERWFLDVGSPALLARADSLGARGIAARLREARGGMLVSPGALAQAITDLERAIDDALAAGDSTTARWAAGNLAQAYFALGDAAAARDAVRRALALLEGSPFPAERAFALSLRGDMAAARGDWPGAESWYGQSAGLSMRNGYAAGLAHARELQANVALRLGQWWRADTLLADGLAALLRGGYRDNAAQLVYLRATAALRRGDGAAARRWLQRARTMVGPDGNLQYFIEAREAELALGAGDLPRAEQLLLAAGVARERWRRAQWRDDVRLAAYQAAPDEADPDVGMATILAALAAGGRTESAFEIAEATRARALLDRLHPDVGTASGARGLAATLRAALPPGVALVEYVVGVGMEPTTVFVATRDSTWAWRTTPVDSLSPRVARFRAVLEGNGDPRPLGRQLGEALLGPLGARLGRNIRHVILVPDGALHRVPFDALVLPDDRYLFEVAATSLMPSARVAVELLRRAPRPRTGRFLGIGDATTPTPPAAPPAGAPASWPPLPAAREEVRLAARYFTRTHTLVGDAATRAAVVAALPGEWSVVHIATHAIADEESPSRMGLVLGGANALLRPADVAPLRIDADLVLLSACRSVIGPTVRGEGMQGLTAPFLAAGARSLVATQWLIGDRSTLPLVHDLFDALADGQPIAESLRLARLRAYRSGAPSQVWASFVAVGNPLVTVPAVRPVDWWSRFLGAAAVVAVLGALAWWRVRGRDTTRRTA